MDNKIILNGVININKEKDYTSHDVVAIVRKYTRQKTGHTGTLDPQAEGVLPVCIGKATKLCDYISAEEKQYICECVLGKATDTQDFTGTILYEKKPEVSEDKIYSACMSFVGDYEQTPPMYSAIKVGGRKLYDLARQGIEIERKKRLVTIKNIKILEIKMPDTIRFIVDCSKGTYIRTLCADIGDKLGCGAHMKSLIRSRSGIFTLENAIKLDKLKEIYTNGQFGDILFNMEKIVSIYPKAIVLSEMQKQLINGNPICLNYVKTETLIVHGQTVSVYDEYNTLIGLFKTDLDKNLLYSVTMLL